MNLNVTTNSKKISKWRQNVMDCPCEKCPVVPICRQKVFNLMEEEDNDRDLRTSIVKFCFDNCDKPTFKPQDYCSLLDKYLEMNILESKYTESTTNQIQTEKIKTVTKALYFKAEDIF
jgi:vesicle coat complex subunit